MKTRKDTLIIYIATIAIGFLAACSGSDPFTESSEQVFLKKISGTWNSSIVTYDGVDVTKSFQSMVLVINENKTITVTNPVAPIWKGTGTFTLVPSGTTFQLKRNDGLLISAELLTPQKLALTFLFDASLLTSRASSVVGNFKFELTK